MLADIGKQRHHGWAKNLSWLSDPLYSIVVEIEDNLIHPTYNK